MEKRRQRLGLALLASTLVLAALITAIVIAAPDKSVAGGPAGPVARSGRSPLPCTCLPKLTRETSGHLPVEANPLVLSDKPSPGLAQRVTVGLSTTQLSRWHDLVQCSLTGMA